MVLHKHNPDVTKPKTLNKGSMEDTHISNNKKQYARVCNVIEMAVEHKSVNSDVFLAKCREKHDAI